MKKSKYNFIVNKWTFSSFKNPIFYLFLFLLNYSCYDSLNELGPCMLYCNPSECLILDAEKCACVKDFECIRKNYFGIDQDADLGDCICEIEDGGAWCSFLTDDSIKTWKFVFAYDTLREDTLNGLYSYGWQDPAGLYQYTVSHGYIRDRGNDYRLSYEPDIYLWEFDNKLEPTKINYYSIDLRSLDQIRAFERTIIKLNPDTLITTWREGEFPGWILLVPYENFNE